MRRSLVATAVAVATVAGLLIGATGAGAAPADPGGPPEGRATFDGVDSEAAWRAALAEASTTEPNTITLAGSFTIEGTDDPTYAGGSQPLTVEGNGFTIDGDGTSRVLVQPGAGAVTLKGATFVDGVSRGIGESGSQGGAIKADGPVTVVDSTFLSNAARSATSDSTMIFGSSAQGGAIWAAGAVVISGSTFEANVAAAEADADSGNDGALGAAVFTYAGLTVADSRFVDHAAIATSRGSGCATVQGGVLFSYSTVEITRSTVQGARAEATAPPTSTCTGTPQALVDGGAVNSSAPIQVVDSTIAEVVATATAPGAAWSRGAAMITQAEITLVNSTVVDNVAGGTGGEGSEFLGGVSWSNEVEVVNSTVTGNAADVGASLYAGFRIDLSGSVLADAGGGAHCGGPSSSVFVVSSGYNLGDDESCSLTGTGPGDVEDEDLDPALGPLQDNGGPTPTRAPLAGSPLLDTTPTESCFTVADQRGEPRPDVEGGRCDTGAVEGVGGGTTNTAPVADAGADRTVASGATVTLDGGGSSDADDDELTYAWVQDSGPAVVLAGADTAEPTFTAPVGPATLTFTLTVDDGNGGTDSDSVTITVEEALTPEETYVDYLYRVVLGRAGDPGGIEYWGARIEAGASREQVARHFLTSAEATRGRTLDQRYLPWLGRPADTGARDFWSPRLQGGQRILDLEISILASSELHGRAGGTTAGYVGELYRVVLGRSPSEADVAFWEARVASRGRSVVAREILFSGESARRRVSAVYQELLERAPTVEERTPWVAALERTGDLRVVEAGVAATWEVGVRAP